MGNIQIVHSFAFIQCWECFGTCKCEHFSREDKWSHFNEIFSTLTSISDSPLEIKQSKKARAEILFFSRFHFYWRMLMTDITQEEQCFSIPNVQTRTNYFTLVLVPHQQLVEYLLWYLFIFQIRSYFRVFDSEWDVRQTNFLSHLQLLTCTLE